MQIDFLMTSSAGRWMHQWMVKRSQDYLSTQLLVLNAWIDNYLSVCVSVHQFKATQRKKSKSNCFSKDWLEFTPLCPKLLRVSANSIPYMADLRAPPLPCREVNIKTASLSAPYYSQVQRR